MFLFTILIRSNKKTKDKVSRAVHLSLENMKPS